MSLISGSELEQSILFIDDLKTDFSEYLEEALLLVKNHPSILEEVEQDLDLHGKKKKELRLKDKEYAANMTESISFDSESSSKLEPVEIQAEHLTLHKGRPRMLPLVAYLFLMVRGYSGSIKAQKSMTFLLESRSLRTFFHSRDLNFPKGSTILDNINAITHKTREYILDKQIETALEDNLDDFNSITIDSTSVKGNTCWPTDSGVLYSLLNRIANLGQKLELIDLHNFNKGNAFEALPKIKNILFEINLIAGKPKSKSNMKKLYKKLLKKGRKLKSFLQKEYENVYSKYKPNDFKPSLRVRQQHALDTISGDLIDIEDLFTYTEDRIFYDIQTKSTEKTLSISDADAAFIEKGERVPVIGYKPQLARSANGFVTCLHVPKGNTADSKSLLPVVLDSIKRTGLTPKIGSFDDGYSSKAGRKELLDLGMKVVSISGSKGKKITPEEDWESTEYKDARNDRSAVESLMFTIKFVFYFGQVARRGIDPVRDELLEKVLAYNNSRTVLLRQKKSNEKNKVA